VLDAGSCKLYHYRHRDYSPFIGRFFQPDPLQYIDGMNLYEYVKGNPITGLDAYGLWGPLVHLTKTRAWAQRVGYPSAAASAVAGADEAVDNGNKGPWPSPVGDQSYHFNRNLSGGMDTRLVRFKAHYSWAQKHCNRINDNPEKAAEELGTALHPLQDWVAHGDYAMKNTGNIWLWHNEKSPQWEFGNPHNYPDDVTLDVVDSPDGRATSAYIIDVAYLRDSQGNGPFRYEDFAYYKKGFKRYEMTRRMTTEELKEYRWYIQTQGGCKCKKYFLGVE
jgi:RHS repeat-associated protein